MCWGYFKQKFKLNWEQLYLNYSIRHPAVGTLYRCSLLQHETFFFKKKTLLPVSLEWYLCNFSSMFQKNECPDRLSMTWSPSLSTSLRFLSSIVQLESLLSAMFKVRNPLFHWRFEITNQPSMLALMQRCRANVTKRAKYFAKKNWPTSNTNQNCAICCYRAGTVWENVRITLRATILQGFALKCCVCLAEPFNFIVWNNMWSR